MNSAILVKGSEEVTGEMDRVDIWGMFLLGLLGTGHCIGMCGPLIFAFPGRTGRFLPHLLYHLGRVTTYTVIGGIMGGIGQVMAGAAAGGSSGGIVMVKVSLWLIAAALLLVLGVTRLGIIREPGWLNAVSPERIPGFKSALEGALGDRGRSAFFVMGVMLGFLPCGLSYGAFAQALGNANAILGVLATLAFGLGTAPGLILMGTGASALFSRYRRQSDIISGVLMIYMAVKMGHKAIKMLF
jgi:sulfite exporter TauE/SafE